MGRGDREIEKEMARKGGKEREREVRRKEIYYYNTFLFYTPGPLPVPVFVELLPGNI